MIISLQDQMKKKGSLDKEEKLKNVIKMEILLVHIEFGLMKMVLVLQLLDLWETYILKKLG